MIPEELSNRKQWVMWKTVVKKPGDRPTKIPYQPNGKLASSTDPATWSTFDECVLAERDYDGFGFVFTPEDPFIGIDLDGCRREDGTLADWASEIVSKFATYTEVSPSKTGVKMFGLASNQWTGINKKEVDAEKVTDKKTPGIEIYDRGRYFAVTMKTLGGYSQIGNVDEPLTWIADKHALGRQSTFTADVKIETSVQERASKYVDKMPPAISGSSGHAAAFKVACVLVKGFNLSIQDAFSVFMSVYNPKCQPPWSEKEVNHKLNSAAKQPGSSGYLSDAAPDQWHRIAIPPSYKEHKPQEEDRKKPSVEFLDVVSAGRKYFDALESGIKPLFKTGIPQLDHSIGGIADGEMVVVAARPSHGKSAIALQISHEMTGNGVPVVIISEEMSAIQLGKRAIQFASRVKEEDWFSNIKQVRDDFEAYFADRAKSLIVESSGSVAKACDAIEFAVETHGVRAAFVDYVQILSSPGKDRYAQVTHASQSLRMLASRLKIPIVVLAQLSREIEKRPTFVPSLRDLKESGQIEQDADVVIGCVWPYKLDHTKPPMEYQLYVLKNRNRETKKPALQCEFIASRQMFMETGMYEHMEKWQSDF